MWDSLWRIGDILRAVYLAARDRPQVTVDELGICQARWCPGCLSDEKGDVIAEGIDIEADIEFLLANNGPVDTSIKSIYLDIKYGKNQHCRLEHSPFYPQERYFSRKVQEIEIKPRKIWGPSRLKFSGSIWNVEGPPQGLKCQLVVCCLML